MILLTPAALFSPLVWAHHSYASFERAVTEVSGVVKEFQWTNPHSWIQVVAAAPGGDPVEWGIETAAPGMLRRGGWFADSIKPGDKVVVQFHKKKDGTNEGSLIKITLPDGTVLEVRDLVTAAPGSPIPKP